MTNVTKFNILKFRDITPNSIFVSGFGPAFVSWRDGKPAGRRGRTDVGETKSQARRRCGRAGSAKPILAAPRVRGRAQRPDSPLLHISTAKILNMKIVQEKLEESPPFLPMHS